MPTSGLSVIILTKDEEVHIARAIDSVRHIAERVFVVDSFSSDKTCDIATAHGAQVYKREFTNQADQYNWALANLPNESEWTMRLDADEYIDPDLAQRLAVIINELPAAVTGIILNRRHMFMGKWIRFGGRYPMYLLRVTRKGQGFAETRLMDEHLGVRSGELIRVAGGFYDDNRHSIARFIEKHNNYAERQAKVELARYDEVEKSGLTIPMQARLKRWIKLVLYDRLPFEVSSLLYFILRYIFQLGFLDGRAGFAYHFLQGFWYRYLVGLKKRAFGAIIPL